MDKDREQLEIWHGDNKHKYKRLLEKSESIITDAIKDKKITINSISGRVKKKDSFCEKAIKDKYKDPLNEITDMAGIRIITYVNSDVERISRIIEEEFHVDEKNSIDKGELLGVDKVGYKSVHYVVKLNEDRTKLTEYKDFKGIYFEVQIRTLLQHAWSEIEHDRNYKFSGVLPEEIRRKFALLAGTLELIDMQFEDISIQIDNYAKDVAAKVVDGDLNNILIDSTSLNEYMHKKFKEEIDSKWLRTSKGLNENTVIQELEEFGIETIADLEDLFKIEINSDKITRNTFTGILRNHMIVKDARKYFTKCWNEHWTAASIELVEMLKDNNIDLMEIKKEYNLKIRVVKGNKKVL